MIDGKAGTWGAKDCAQRRAPAAERKMLGYPGETHETFVMSGMCQYDAIKVTVGDVLVLKKSQASDDVFAVPSQWHYAECATSRMAETHCPQTPRQPPLNSVTQSARKTPTPVCTLHRRASPPARLGSVSW